MESVTVNGREYRLRDVPVVGICLDGTEPGYLDAAAGVMPNLAALRSKGCAGFAQSVLPSFTNPNNIAIATGVPSEVNGICGNYYYDQTTGEEVMMNDPKYLRCPTIFAGLAQHGAAVAVVTAKEKLRRLLGKGLRGICFSVEHADRATLEENGIDDIAGKVGRASPGIYDPEISVYCLEAGVRLLELGLANVLYLSTTDFVQHKYRPGSAEATSFFARVDEMLGRLDRLGAVVALTADHGMNDKTNEDGSPKVHFLEDVLHQAGFPGVRVILPITDPYVVHHGALGSYATIYLDGNSPAAAAHVIEGLAGVELVLGRAEASTRFHLPPDRIGDLVVLGSKNVTFGRTPGWHDLSAVKTGLRSHGGLHERTVPFIVSRRLLPEYAERLSAGQTNNYDLFDFALNGTED